MGDSHGPFFVEQGHGKNPWPSFMAFCILVKLSGMEGIR
jgi:hypothetical protein